MVPEDLEACVSRCHRTREAPTLFSKAFHLGENQLSHMSNVE